MKQKLRIWGLLLSVLLIVMLLISCGEEPKSAYDVAVENGYVGTEEQWLASLKGQDLDIMDIYAAAIADGKYTGDGDFLSFLEEYLHLDSEMIAEAILKYQDKDTSRITALPLLGSVSIQCSSSSIGTGGGTSAGSGVILDIDKTGGDAYILTNYHVVMRSNSANASPHSAISVFLYGDKVAAASAIQAKYIGGSFNYDIAVLKVTNSDKIRSSNALPVSVGNSDDIVTGADAIAIGNGAGLGISVTRGIVSIDSKMVRVTAEGESQRLLQIDTPVNEGNSGGGLFDSDGKLIGIVSAKMEEENVENIGYAIPSNIAVRAAKRIIADFEKLNNNTYLITPTSLNVVRLGIEMTASDAYASYDMERGVTYITETVTVSKVEYGSLAATAGFRAGDVIKTITVDGTEIEVLRDFTFRDALLLCNTASKVTVKIMRGETAHTLTFTVSESNMAVKK